MIFRYSSFQLTRESSVHTNLPAQSEEAIRIPKKGSPRFVILTNMLMIRLLLITRYYVSHTTTSAFSIQN